MGNFYMMGVTPYPPFKSAYENTVAVRHQIVNWDRLYAKCLDRR